MKKFKLIGMVLVAIIMGVNFTSCKPDDEPEKPEDPVEEPTKKLVKFTRGGVEATLKYDDQGRLIECIDGTEGIETSLIQTYTYVWGENTIDIHYSLKFTDFPEITKDITLNLENGLASGINDDPFSFNHSFKYNSSNRLIEFAGLLGSYTMEWNDDMLIKMDGDLNIGNDSKSFSYENANTTKGYNPHLAYLITEEFLYVAHPELAALSTQKLIDSEIWCGVYYGEVEDEYQEFNYNHKYEYEFDEDGYINRVIVKYVDDGDEYIQNEYNMTWE